jgi:hypothetical protein
MTTTGSFTDSGIDRNIQSTNFSVSERNIFSLLKQVYAKQCESISDYSNHEAIFRTYMHIYGKKLLEAISIIM